MPRLLAFLLLGLGLPLACAPAKKTDTPPGLEFEDEIRTAVYGRGAGIGLTDTVGMGQAWAWLEVLYQRNDYRPFWSNGRRLRGESSQLIDAVRAVEAAGLDPRDYDSDRLTALRHLSNRSYAAAEDIRPQTLARFDVLATYVVYRIAQHLRQGRVPRYSLDPDWIADSLAGGGPEAMQRVLGHDPSRLFAEREPRSTGYRRLRAMLERHRAVSRDGGWPEIAAGPPLKVGERGERVSALIRRLRLSGDFRPGAVDTVYDLRLERAVGNLQSRLGIPVSGIVGEATRAALNIPVEQRIRQIELNMERWRWLPDTLGKRHVIVNIPAYRLDLVRDGQVTRSMRVVVGRKRSPTPVFSDRIVYLDVNPTWTLPPSVVTKEIVPELKKDRDYLEKNNMRVISIANSKRDTVDSRQVPWKEAASDSFPYLVIQAAGPENPLGGIKLMCPNEYDVYLHDTPMRSRFSVAVRDYSHGCVRVEHAVELADSLLQAALEDSVRLDSLVVWGESKRVRLPASVPVHFLYWTAWVDSAGRMNYREDTYGLDQRLDEALKSRRSRALAVNPGVEVSRYWVAAEIAAQAAAERRRAAVRKR